MCENLSGSDRISAWDERISADGHSRGLHSGAVMVNWIQRRIKERKRHMYEQDGQFFQYKGKPLVRSGNVIYYGSMMDDYVVMLQIKSTKEEAGRKLPDQIVVQLMRTDKNVKPQDVVVKKADKSGLYNALDVADIWLRRSLSEQQ